MNRSHLTRMMLLAFAVTAVAGQAPAAEFARSVSLVDTQGRQQTPLDPSDNAATVLFFVLPDCPISNAYAPEIQRIATEYGAKNVASLIVYVDPDLTLAEAQNHAGEYGWTSPVVCDTKRELVKRTGVRFAPEVVVLGPDGQQRYRGRIDNLYADYGKRRAQPTERDLRDALDAILAGKPVPKETTKAIGCFIAQD